MRNLCLLDKNQSLNIVHYSNDKNNNKKKKPDTRSPVRPQSVRVPLVPPIEINTPEKQISRRDRPLASPSPRRRFTYLVACRCEADASDDLLSESAAWAAWAPSPADRPAAW